MEKLYRTDLDLIKGIAITAVILYHVGLLPYGYLGVDTFFVINGFLIIPSLIKNIADGQFSYIQWIQKRICRFLPLVLIASILCLCLGYWVMIPDDYENLSESVVASCLFCSNILSAITTKNYWAAINEYKPLMHLWYLGIAVQFYLLLPLVLLLVKRIFKKRANLGTLEHTMIILTLVSFILYLLPQYSFNEKFYYVPFRIWEFGVGGIAGIIMSKQKTVLNKSVYWSVFATLIGCYLIGFTPLSQIDHINIIGATSISTNVGIWSSISKDLLLVTSVLATLILLLKKYKMGGGSILQYIGRMSFSLFIWHQIFLAFLRYAFVDAITFWIFVGYILGTFFVSYLSYKYIEPIRITRPINKILLYGFTAVVIAVAFLIYRHAGVVRDVPELGITLSNPYASRNTEYIDRIYDYDKPFATDKIKVLVVGNSFARDFACVLLEWDKDNRIELSYQFDYDDTQTDHRYEECDYLFYLGAKYDVPAEIWQRISPSCQVYGIGTKNFGKCFGRIYAKRHTMAYYDSAIPVHPLCRQVNDSWKKSWGANYMDFVRAAQREDGLIRLFTPDKMIISFDCQHLTPAGGRYFATQFDFEHIFNE